MEVSMMIPVDKIKNVQDRIPYYEKKVEQMRPHIDDLPPILVWRQDSEYYLANGTHRLFAHMDEKRKFIKARVFDTKQEARDVSER